MQKLTPVLLLLSTVLLLQWGCKKDPLHNETYDVSLQTTERADLSHTFISNDVVETDTATKATVLGATRVNPYTVANFTAAYNELYEPDISALPTTDWYIKFLPATAEQVLKLTKSDLNMYEYPLDREVLEMGDYYTEPGAAPDQITPFYAVVKPNQSLPDVPYEKLADLHLRSPNEALTRQALIRTGYNPDVTGFVIGPGDTGGGGGGGGSSEYETNSCGCTVYKEQRKPGGCIQVKDVQKAVFEGVRRVKVILKDGWFTEDETWTDDNGCFRVNDKYYGVAWMWVKFKSDRVKIRGTKKSFKAVWEWAFAVKDYVGKLGGPRFNDIEVKYEAWTDQGSAAHLYWGAATVNNALHTFHDYAATDGINAPPPILDIFVGRNHRYGYALMTAQNMMTQGVFMALLQATFFTGPFSPLIAVIGASAIQSYLPDVYVGIKYHNSDALKWLAYHEITHASHWTKAGIGYWNDVVRAEILANGHGDATSNNAELIALVESWAEHIGTTYTARTYPSLPNTAQYGSWMTYLERTRNETTSHIPVGFYNDLIDTSIDGSTTACDQQTGACGLISDAVSGFTNAQFFGLLDATTLSPLIFKDKLILGAPTSTQTLVNNLFNSY